MNIEIPVSDDQSCTWYAVPGPDRNGRLIEIYKSKDDLVTFGDRLRLLEPENLQEHWMGDSHQALFYVVEQHLREKRSRVTKVFNRVGHCCESVVLHSVYNI